MYTTANIDKLKFQRCAGNLLPGKQHKPIYYEALSRKVPCPVCGSADKSRYVHEHAVYGPLSEKRDDLLCVLLTYGNALGPALKYVRREFKVTEKKCEQLAKKLGEEGWKEIC